MYLDRSLIKHQAKELIRGKVGNLFIVIFIISLCSSALVVLGNIMTILVEKDTYINYYGNPYSNYFDDYFDDYDDYGDYRNDFDRFGSDNSFSGSDFYNFGESRILPSKYVVESGSISSLSGVGSTLSSAGILVSIALMPLSVTLLGYFVLFIRGKQNGTEGGIKWLFKNTFNETYGQKLGVAFLKGIITYALSLLFIIPGIVFNYSSYFAYQIMCDNPELKPMDAIKLSKKIIKGNRTELFLLDLSFIPWGLLCIFVLPVIYVLPYVYTTQALYYENFRIRALQQGRVTEDDFLSERQKMMKYSAGAAGYNQYYNPNTNPYQQQQNPYYYNPAGTQQPPQYNPAQSQYTPTQAPFNPPVQSEQPVQPQDVYYTEPQEPANPEYSEPQEPHDFQE